MGPVERMVRHSQDIVNTGVCAQLITGLHLMSVHVIAAGLKLSKYGREGFTISLVSGSWA